MSNRSQSQPSKPSKLPAAASSSTPVSALISACRLGGSTVFPQLRCATAVVWYCTLMRQKALQTENSHSTIDLLEHCTTLAVGADTEWVEQDWCIVKLTGVAIPQHDSGHATTVALKRGACEPAPSDAGSVRWWCTSTCCVWYCTRYLSTRS